MAIDPAILGGSVILGGGHFNDAPTCTIQMHDGSSSKGLECIVQPISHLTSGQLSLIIGGVFLFVLLVFALIVLQEHRAEKRWLELQADYYYETKKSRKRVKK